MADGSSLLGFAHGALPALRMALPLAALCVAVAALTNARSLSRRLALQGRRMRALADAAFDGLIIARAGHIVDVNPALARLMGVGPGWFDHRRVDSLLQSGPPSHLEPAAEQRLILPDGSLHPVEVVARQVDDTAEQVLAIRDLAPSKATQAQIDRLTHTDLLTGVGNRQALQKSLAKMISMADRAGRGFALLRVDLDRFKAINDAFGLGIGDRLLVQAAQRLCATVREVDTVARIGSDEFGIVQPLTGRPADAAALAGRIISEMALPFDIDGQLVKLGASVGIALYPDDGASGADLMSRAALALNRARKDGHGTWRYCEPGMDRLLRQRQALAHDLGTALIENQFSLVYQPFFESDSLRVAGCEALLRWTHPRQGMVSPATFIPIAEECGLIVPIGLWVLRTACAAAAAWTNPITVSVNLSPVQFQQDNIAERIGAILRETGLAPTRLELEITEGLLMDDTEQAMAMLTALRRLGVKLAMDDFGTGYSSLSYLKKFLFDKLKIDRSFIRDLDDSADARPIVQAIIAMARSLHLNVTAEGVETERQLAYLRQQGCRFVQGFLLGRPEPIADLRWATHAEEWEAAAADAGEVAAHRSATGD